MNSLLLISLAFLFACVLCKKPAPPVAPPVTPPPVDPLGLLAGLEGTWVGTGFTMVSLPDFDSNAPSTGPKNFRLLLHNTKECLTFSPIGGQVPNRGSLTTFGGKVGQPDIQLSGLTYLQRVSDADTNQALHVETGMWINVPASTFPPVPAALVRMGTIPHGNSMMASSSFQLSVQSGPLIGLSNSTPIAEPFGPNIGPGYLKPFNTPQGEFSAELIQNPNSLLLDAIANQTIVNTVVFSISTNNNGGILNIPFVDTNANTTSLDAIFWIETVENDDGTTFQQLQYTQTIIFNFLNINWPHITVSTLVQQ